MIVSGLIFIASKLFFYCKFFQIALLLILIYGLQLQQF
jgi:hypothetical protein